MNSGNNESEGYVGHSRTQTVAFAAAISHSFLAPGFRTSKEPSSWAIVASSLTEEVKSPFVTPLAREDIEWREPDVIQEVFSSSREVQELVLEAARELGRAFGEQAEIAVEPLIDPEISGASPHIMVVAVTSLSFEESEVILDTVLEGWWRENQDRADYRVSLATELV